MKIGELAKRMKINIDTIRYYERQQLLPLPDRTMSGYRDYSKDDEKRLLFIVHARQCNKTRSIVDLRSEPCLNMVKLRVKIKLLVGATCKTPGG